MTFKTRFAPSPTGYLHMGNARAALISYLAARKNNGEFVLRIDDTDEVRSKPEYEDAIKADLKWLGINWDETCNQRNRWDLYNSKIDALKKSGRLYPCYETAQELSLKRKAALSAGKPPIYDRAALDVKTPLHDKPHWRFKLFHEKIQWHDLIRGDVSFDGSDMSDPVVIREDGSPLYHLCSVIDDIDLGITHIVRGEDHVSNTAAHIQMFEALGGVVPTFAHLPLLTAAGGDKLSKRKGSLSIGDIREDNGLEAMSIVSLLARLGTNAPIEEFASIEPLIDSFSFDNFSRNSPKFDEDDLLRLNAKLLHDKPPCDAGGINEALWLAIRGNIEKMSDAKKWENIAFGEIIPIIEDGEFIKTAATLLPPEPWDENTWKAWTCAIKAETGRKGKALFLPLRLALTGENHGSEMGAMLPLIGRTRALKRLEITPNI